MKRYILSSSNFTGEVHVVYSGENKLCAIDFLNSDLTEEQIGYFKTKCPVIYTENFAQAFEAKGKLTITEQGFTISFDQFWADYKLKRNRDRCEKLWAKMSEAEQVNAWAGLKPYERHLALNTWKTKADPETYLKKRYWLNEYK
jgi:hypothetical protein